MQTIKRVLTKRNRISHKRLTLMDVLIRRGKIHTDADIVDHIGAILVAKNELLADMVWKPVPFTAHRRITIQTSLPACPALDRMNEMEKGV